MLLREALASASIARVLITERFDDEFPARQVQRAFGVTRIARITGLDRTGVEVCSAIRPFGHVLQVSNGKGRTLEQAAAAALSEAAELSAAETVRTHELKYGSRRQLEDAGLRCIWPDPEVSGEAELLFMGWTQATLLGGGDDVWVPAHYVYCPPAGVFLGPRVFRWTSNGLAAHASRDEAIRHALREVIERDQLAKAFPEGWTRELSRERRILPPDHLAGLYGGLEAAGFKVVVVELRPPAKHRVRGVSVAAALLFDLEDGPIPLTAGYGCAVNFEQAYESALLEAAQSRLTDIHGAREDIAQDRQQGLAEMRSWWSDGERRWSQKPIQPKSARAEIALLSSALKEKGFDEIAVVTLATRPLHVVRVVVPGLQLSELL